MYTCAENSGNYSICSAASTLDTNVIRVKSGLAVYLGELVPNL